MYDEVCFYERGLQSGQINVYNRTHSTCVQKKYPEIVENQNEKKTNNFWP